MSSSRIGIAASPCGLSAGGAPRARLVVGGRVKALGAPRGSRVRRSNVAYPSHGTLRHRLCPGRWGIRTTDAGTVSFPAALRPGPPKHLPPWGRARGRNHTIGLLSRTKIEQPVIADVDEAMPGPDPECPSHAFESLTANPESAPKPPRGKSPDLAFQPRHRPAKPGREPRPSLQPAPAPRKNAANGPAWTLRATVWLASHSC